MISKHVRRIIPLNIRAFIWSSIPRFQVLNTYILKSPRKIQDLHKISDEYSIREVEWTDIEELKKFHEIRGSRSFMKIPPRLDSQAWHGLAIFDRNNEQIAYLAWIIDKSIPYFEEFDIVLKDGQFLLKDGYCSPSHRHKGLHTRMEQERINYCVNNGANEIYIQIHDSNKKGIDSVLGNGYVLYKKSLIIKWPLFRVYRSLKGFIINPFRKVVK